MGSGRSKHTVAGPSKPASKGPNKAEASPDQDAVSKQPASVPAWVTSQGSTTTNATATTTDQNFTSYCIVFILGGPGCGKGTQCERIVAKYGYAHLSAGDLLRDEVKKGTPQGKEIEAIMREGKLVPTELTVRLLKAAMQRSAATNFLIDGFPRALDQAHLFEQDIKPPDLVIYLDCPQEVMLQRLMHRAESSARADDNAETIKKRFQTFLECSLPVVEHYERSGKAVRISAVPPPDEVFLEVDSALSRLPCQQESAGKEALAA